MSVGWSKLLDAGPLADRQARLDFVIAVAEFPRLAPQLRETAGEVRGEASFERDKQLAVVEVRARAELVLTCQRCLGPLRWTLECEGRAALVATPEEADRAPEDLETVFAEGHRISLRDLVEEELLLALPLVPRHETEQDCVGDHADADNTALPDQAEPQEVHRPFGQLQELFKRR